jgi:hypothetical protein
LSDDHEICPSYKSLGNPTENTDIFARLIGRNGREIRQAAIPLRKLALELPDEGRARARLVCQPSRSCPELIAALTDSIFTNSCYVN